MADQPDPQQAAKTSKAPATGNGAETTLPSELAALQPFADAYAAYLQDLSDIWTKASEACAAENEDYTRYLQEAARKSDSKGLEEAWQRYVAGIKRAWDESQHGYEEAFRAHTAAFKKAFGKLASDLDPRSLSALGATAISASQQAESTIGNWNLLPSYGVDPRLTLLLVSMP
ncbi:MAG TPA: hypothetical protein VN493_17810 [Thermoanaerobaculia bacterium]|nr:hypothetical protein [Thermoanaerobaculia bacterium]